MDLTKCAEILSKRQCSGSDVCCAAHGFNIPPRKAVIIGGESNPVNIKNDDEYILLKSFDEYALLEMFIALQRDRVLEYANFTSAIQFLITGSRLHEYPQLVAEMTSRFSVISAQIIKIKEALIERKIAEWGRQIGSLQSLEREKLTVVASLHLDMIQKSRPELLQSASVSGCEVLCDSTYATRRVTEIEAAISEITESLQGELCDR